MIQFDFISEMYIKGPLRSMASASGESPIDYHHSWGMCGNDGMQMTIINFDSKFVY
jgi:hypothetical protein